VFQQQAETVSHRRRMSIAQAWESASSGCFDLFGDQTAATQKREEGPGIFADAHIDRSVL